VHALDRLAGVTRVDLVDVAAQLERSAMRLPGAPPASKSEPMLIATPKQIVCTSGLTNCIVS
jgi:hypothetical protein